MGQRDTRSTWSGFHARSLSLVRFPFRFRPALGLALSPESQGESQVTATLAFSLPIRAEPRGLLAGLGSGQQRSVSRKPVSPASRASPAAKAIKICKSSLPALRARARNWRRPVVCVCYFNYWLLFRLQRMNNSSRDYKSREDEGFWRPGLAAAAAAASTK